MVPMRPKENCMDSSSLYYIVTTNTLHHRFPHCQSSPHPLQCPSKNKQPLLSELLPVPKPPLQQKRNRPILTARQATIQHKDTYTRRRKNAAAQSNYQPRQQHPLHLRRPCVQTRPMHGYVQRKKTEKMSITRKTTKYER